MDSSRPKLETVEVERQLPPVQTPPPHEGVPASPPPLPENQPEIPKKGVGHHISKLVFLFPAILIIGTILVAAYFFNTSFRQYTQPTPAPTVAPTLPPSTPEPTIPPQAKRNSYQAEKFSFNYSSDLLLTECDDFVYLKAATSSAETNGECIDVKDDYTVSVRSSKTRPSTNFNDVEESETTVDGVEGTKYVSQLEDEYFEVVTFSQVLSDETLPTYFTIRNNESQDYSDEFSEILNSFKLVKVDPTDTWESYEDITYDYSFKYPPEWAVVPPAEKSKGTKKIVEVRKNADDFKIHTLHIEADELGEVDPELSASEIIVSTRNLAGWASKPPIEYRNIGGGTAQVLQGVLEGKWHTFVIIWRKNVFIQMSWSDEITKTEQDTFNHMFSSFKFLN